MECSEWFFVCILIFIFNVLDILGSIFYDIRGYKVSYFRSRKSLVKVFRSVYGKGRKNSIFY